MQDANIAAAVEPQRAEMVARTRAAAEKHYARLLLKLEAAGFNLDVAAPAPNGNMSRAQYKQAAALRIQLVSITERTPKQPSYSFKEPHMCKVLPARVAKRIQEAEDQAHVQFDAYIYKLSDKIGETRSASLNDSYIWNGSVLTVDSVERGPEKWGTQMILNVSVLGTLFNQWPTRLIK